MTNIENGIVVFDPEKLKNCSAPILEGFVKRCTRIIDSGGRSADGQAQIVAFRDLLTAELDSRVAK